MHFDSWWWHLHLMMGMGLVVRLWLSPTYGEGILWRSVLVNYLHVRVLSFFGMDFNPHRGKSLLNCIHLLFDIDFVTLLCLTVHLCSWAHICSNVLRVKTHREHQPRSEISSTTGRRDRCGDNQLRKLRSILWKQQYRKKDWDGSLHYFEY